MARGPEEARALRRPAPQGSNSDCGSTTGPAGCRRMWPTTWATAGRLRRLSGLRLRRRTAPLAPMPVRRLSKLACSHLPKLYHQRLATTRGATPDICLSRLCSVPAPFHSICVSTSSVMVSSNPQNKTPNLIPPHSLSCRLRGALMAPPRKRVVLRLLDFLVRNSAPARCAAATAFLCIALICALAALRCMFWASWAWCLCRLPRATRTWTRTRCSQVCAPKGFRCHLR